MLLGSVCWVVLRNTLNVLMRMLLGIERGLYSIPLSTGPCTDKYHIVLWGLGWLVMVNIIWFRVLLIDLYFSSNKDINEFPRLYIDTVNIVHSCVQSVPVDTV